MKKLFARLPPLLYSFQNSACRRAAFWIIRKEPQQNDFILPRLLPGGLLLVLILILIFAAVSVAVVVLILVLILVLVLILILVLIFVTVAV